VLVVLGWEGPSSLEVAVVEDEDEGARVRVRVDVAVAVAWLAVEQAYWVGPVEAGASVVSPSCKVVTNRRVYVVTMS
jgi:hypothetical protein